MIKESNRHPLDAKPTVAENDPYRSAYIQKMDFIYKNLSFRDKLVILKTKIDITSLTITEYLTKLCEVGDTFDKFEPSMCDLNEKLMGNLAELGLLIRLVEDEIEDGYELDVTLKKLDEIIQIIKDESAE